MSNPNEVAREIRRKAAGVNLKVVATQAEARLAADEIDRLEAELARVTEERDHYAARITKWIRVAAENRREIDRVTEERDRLKAENDELQKQIPAYVEVDRM